MCGVAGIFAYHYAAPPVDRGELRTIRDHMSKRGPDGKGEWHSQDCRVGLGHRRLAIIDLSKEAAQPMATEDGQLVISFNGEIYNYQALRKQLKKKGYRFRTHSDTEVLLHLYSEKGEGMVKDLRGMFAFALWDAKKQSLLLVRDPYGIKPLYYADDGWTLRVASQVKAILSGGRVSLQSDPAGIVGFYLFGSVPEPYTIHQDIRALPAGSFMWVDSTGSGQPQQYFSISETWAEAGQTQISDEERQVQVRDALLDSVKHHMVADVPVGAFLSAGIDSGALVGLMSELDLGSQQLSTICLAFEEFRGQHNDESILAKKVAEHYGTHHTTRFITFEEFQSDLPKIMEAMDQPTIDGINTWFVAKAAKEQGLKVAVSGLGGDELFGGYPSFRDIPSWVKALWLPAHVPGLGLLAERLMDAVKPIVNRFNPKISGMIRYGTDYEGAYLLKRGLFLPSEIEQLVDPDVAKEGLRRLQPLRYIAQTIEPRPTSAYGKVAALESALYMRNQLLRDTDWAAMAHSLEVRVPLVDAILLRKLASTLQTVASDGKKRVLASALKNPLPQEIAVRAKSGFTTPISHWQQRYPNIQNWRSNPILNQSKCPWARRWAYSLLRDGSAMGHQEDIRLTQAP